MRKLITIITICSLVSCSSYKKTVKTKDKTFNISVKLISDDNVKEGETVHFVLVNNTTKVITIHNSAKKRIEKFENNLWQKVRILYCP